MPNAKTLFTYQQSRNFSDLVAFKIVKRSERLAAQFNRDSPKKMAIFAHDHIGIHINQYGMYDKPDLDMLFGFLAPLADAFRSGVALDVGANIGNHALFFSERFRTVHAFEPNPATYYLLEFNAKQADNIVPYGYGLSSENGVLQLHEDLDNMGAASIKYAAGENAASVQIEVRRLDDLDLPIDGLCFVKIDVEGFEPEVLRGSLRTITTHQPVIAMEQLEREFVDGETESIAMLRDAGYRFCWPKSSHRSKRGLARQLDSLRNRLFGRPDLIEMISADRVPVGGYNLLVAVPPRFQGALGLA